MVETLSKNWKFTPKSFLQLLQQVHAPTSVLKTKSREHLHRKQGTATVLTHPLLHPMAPLKQWRPTFVGKSDRFK